MSLSAREVFAHADDRHQGAVPCFDVAGGNADIVDAVSATLAEVGMGAFLSSTPRSIADYLGMDHFVNAVAEGRDRYGVVLAAHLDHADDPADIEAALTAGVRSVMFDGSRLPLEENIATSCELIERTRSLGATLEVEVGVIPGKEDPGHAPAGRIADVEDVAVFLEAVGPDLFAPAIGTIHGRRGGEAEIAWETAEIFGRMFGGPLVLHGSTGLDEADIRRLVSMRYRKVNYATAVRDAFVAGIESGLCNETELPRPQHVLAAGRESVQCLILKVLANVS